MPPPDRLTMPTAAQLVANAIRKQIVTGELADGDSLAPEAALIEQYGISRPTFREALRILQSESLLSIRRGSRGGARVNAPTIEPIARQAGYLLQYQGTTLGDVYQARAVLEPPCAALLATSTRSVKRALRAALEVENAAALDGEEFPRASARFHEEVIRLAGNNTLALFAGILHGIIESHTQDVYGADPDQRERTATSGAAHSRLVEIVEDGDAARAEAHWRAHLEAIGSRMKRSNTLRRPIDLFTSA
jgi:DNA-binding FadR family transcriptional regulator